MTAATSAAPADKLDFKLVFPIFVIVLVDLLGLTIIIPLLPLYAASFGATPLLVGVIGAIYPLMQLIGSPLLGQLSDQLGRKPVLLVSQIGTFAGFILLGFANGLPLLMISRAIDGLSGGNIVAAQAAITDSTTEKTRAQGLGLIGAAFGLGFTLGPAIAGIALALSGNDFRVPAFIAAGFSLLSILLTRFWFRETLTPARRAEARTRRGGVSGWLHNFQRAFSLPVVALLLVLMFMQQLVFGGFEQLLSLFTLGRLGMDAAGNALLFVFVGIVLVFVQGKYIGPWSRRFGERRLILAALALLAAGLIASAVTPSQTVPWYSYDRMLQQMSEAGARASETGVQVPLPPDGSSGLLGLAWLLVAMVPIAIGGGLLSPSINALITRRVSASEVGATLGVSASLVSAANAITPLIGGAIFQFLGISAPFLLGGVVLALLLWVVTRRLKPGVDQVAATVN